MTPRHTIDTGPGFAFVVGVIFAIIAIAQDEAAFGVYAGVVIGAAWCMCLASYYSGEDR